jgi:hypothetical protein
MQATFVLAAYWSNVSRTCGTQLSSLVKDSLVLNVVIVPQRGNSLQSRCHLKDGDIIWLAYIFRFFQITQLWPIWQNRVIWTDGKPDGWTSSRSLQWRYSTFQVRRTLQIILVGCLVCRACLQYIFVLCSTHVVCWTCVICVIRVTEVFSSWVQLCPFLRKTRF